MLSFFRMFVVYSDDLAKDTPFEQIQVFLSYLIVFVAIQAALIAFVVPVALHDLPNGLNTLMNTPWQWSSFLPLSILKFLFAIVFISFCGFMVTIAPFMTILYLFYYSLTRFFDSNLFNRIIIVSLIILWFFTIPFYGLGMFWYNLSNFAIIIYKSLFAGTFGSLLILSATIVNIILAFIIVLKVDENGVI